MSVDWEFGFLLPHTDFPKAIVHEPLALVPPSDSRLLQLASQSKGVKALVENFRDQFGTSIRPSALLFQKTIPASTDFYAHVCFRNIIAISSIIDSCTTRLSGGSARYPSWTDYFDFYPFTVSSDDELIGRSVDVFEIAKPQKFIGQKAPQLAINDKMNFGIDKFILAGCIEMWDRMFLNQLPRRAVRVFFRSIEVAFQAMRLPGVGTRHPTIHDVGVGIGLWVSAFEVLSRFNQSRANLWSVVDLLGEAEMIDGELDRRRYRLSYGKRLKQKINLVQKLYPQLYRARNNFLHGNPVEQGSVYPFGNTKGPSLLDCAPLIYRAALHGFFRSYLSSDRLEAMRGKSRSEKLTIMIAQSSFEDAVKVFT